MSPDRSGVSAGPSDIPFMNVLTLYAMLRERFGQSSDPATWWPILHGVSEPPEFERVISNILVQNSNWRTVPSAMGALANDGLLTAGSLAGAPPEKIANCIKPTGLQSQKATRLKNLCSRVIADFTTEGAFCRTVTRDYLLAIGGIGSETADRILLYACGQQVWPVDTYCLRVFARYGIITEIPATPANRRISAQRIKALVIQSLPPIVDDWQRLHALMQLEGEQLRVSRTVP